MADFHDDPTAPGYYISPSLPGRFRFDVASCAMVPVSGKPANQSVPTSPQGSARNGFDADEVLRPLSFSGKLWLLLDGDLFDLDAAQLHGVYAALAGAPADKNAFNAWAQKRVSDPESKDSWVTYFRAFARKRDAANGRRANAGVPGLKDLVDLSYKESMRLLVLVFQDLDEKTLFALRRAMVDGKLAGGAPAPDSAASFYTWARARGVSDPDSVASWRAFLGTATPRSPEEAGKLTADNIMEQLPLGERMRFLAILLNDEKGLRLLHRVFGDVATDRAGFYAWARGQDIDPEADESWAKWLLSRAAKPANGTLPAARIRTNRARTGKKKPPANGLVDDFLSYMALNNASSGTTPASPASPLAGFFGGALAPATPAAPAAVNSLAATFEGQLLQVEGDVRVYVIQGGQKCWVNSADVMQSRFNSQLVNGHWTGVNYVSSSVLAAFPDGPTING